MRMSRLRSVLFSLAIALTALRVAAQTNESAKPQNGLSKLQMIDGKRHWIVRSTKFPSPKSTAPTVQELFVPFFMAADGFSPVLWIQNKRFDTAITVRPSAILPDGTEVALKSVKVGAHDISIVDLNSELGSTGGLRMGALSLRYDFPDSGAISAFVRNSNQAEQLFVNSHSRERDQFSGTTLDAILWSPGRETTGLVSILNASSTQRKVMVSLLDGSSKNISELSIKPRTFFVLKLDSLIDHLPPSGAGLRIIADGQPGDIIAEGAVLNKQIGFARRVQFVDTSVHFHQNTLRTDFLLLGTQSASYGFPQVAFRSIVVVRNVGTAVARVTPVLSHGSDATDVPVVLPDLVVGSLQTIALDLGAAQARGLISSDFHFGSLELRANTPFLAELFTHDESGGYEIGPNLVQHPGRGNSSIWKIDGAFRTTIAIRNLAKTSDTATVTFYNGSQAGFAQAIEIPAGGLKRIDVNGLSALPADAQGNLFTGTSGVVAVHGAHGSNSSLLVDRLVYSPNQADYVGFPASPCDDVLDAFIDLSELNNSGNDAFNSTYSESWSDGSQTQAAVAPSSISNPSLATASGTEVIFNTSSLAPGNIQEVEIDFFEEEIDSACDVITLEFVLFIQFELATTKSQTNFMTPGTNQQVAPDGTVECFVNPYCTAATSPPACNPNFVLQSPVFAGAPGTTCRSFYITTWLAQRFAGDTFWNCFPLLPGQNATGVSDSTLGVCTKQ
jgi:hypothetical protein